MPSDLCYNLAARYGLSVEDVHSALHPDEDIDAHFEGLAALAEDFLNPEVDPPLVPECERCYSPHLDDCPTCRGCRSVPDLAGTLYDDCPTCSAPIPYQVI